MVALDLYAGMGWGVACKALGIREYGVEIMPEAIETRLLNGMLTPYHDALQGLVEPLITGYNLLIASPPCQPFSTTGGQHGARALEEIIQTLRAKTLTLAVLEELGEKVGDERAMHVLVPMVYIKRDMPMFVVLEQVPGVLPVWDAYATELRAIGYSAITGVLNASAYGVPQDRSRAILIARRDGKEARMPSPTHSTYRNRRPDYVEPGMQRWVSMVDALPGLPPAVAMRSNYGTHGNPKNRGMRSIHHPAPTVTSKIGKNKWITADMTMRNVSVREAAVLQTFPREFEFAGDQNTQRLQIGNAVPPLFAQRILEVFL